LNLEHILPIPAYVASLAAAEGLAGGSVLRGLPAGANAIEYRMDLAGAPVGIEHLLALDSRCSILTYRTSREGGRFAGSGDAYRKKIEQAYAAGATVDVEIRSGLLADASFCPDRKRVIASAHPAAGLPPVTAREAACVEARAVKLVWPAGSLGESLAVASQQAGADARVAIVPMGRASAPGRILSSRFGAALTYGSAGVATAEGQLRLAEMLEVYRVADRHPVERLFGIIGREAASTLSPVIHNALFARYGLPWLYLPLPIDDFEAEWPALGAFEPAFAGLSVTIPWKGAAAAVARPSEEVKATGVANTLLRQTAFENQKSAIGTWDAFNTDVDGVFAPLADFGGGNGRAAVVVGAGGAGRAAALAALRLGYEVTLASRRPERAQEAAAALGIRTAPVRELPGIVADLWIHATPLGGSGDDPLPLPQEAFTSRPIVLDCVYRRDAQGALEQTRLVREARSAGCRVIDGATMLAHQAVRQAALFEVPEATPEEILGMLGRRP
jgi:3-dehydroquinate dehydratase / shikimate dehydrogenase